MRQNGADDPQFYRIQQLVLLIHNGNNKILHKLTEKMIKMNYTNSKVTDEVIGYIIRLFNLINNSARPQILQMEGSMLLKRNNILADLPT